MAAAILGREDLHLFPAPGVAIALLVDALHIRRIQRNAPQVRHKASLHGTVPVPALVVVVVGHVQGTVAEFAVVHHHVDLRTGEF